MRRHPVLMALGATVLVLAVVGFFVVRAIRAGGGDTREIPLSEVVRRYQASTSTTVPTSASVSTSATSTTSTTSTASIASTASTTGVTSTPIETSAAPSTSTSTSTVDTAAVMPEPGVYLYATTGTDSIDVLGGVHHDYPETTTITVTATDCGALQRWDVVAERWEEWQRCVAGSGVVEPGRVNYDEFFDVGEKHTYVCEGDPRPLDAAAGTTWTRTCRKGDHQDSYTGTVIGVEPVSIGGSEVQALHVRVEIDNGRASDHQSTDAWYQLGTDLLLVRSTSNHTTNDTTYGLVHYDEKYELRLTSLEPLR